MKNRIGILAWFALSAVIVSPGAYAEEQYQTAVSGLYSLDDGDQGSRTASYGVQGRVYFKPVNTEGHPYGEAAFLERIGSVYAVAQKEEFRVSTREGDGPLFRIGVNAAKPHFPVVVEANYTRSTRDYDLPSTLDVENDAFGIRVGNFFAETWLAGVQYLYSAWDNGSASLSHTIVRQEQYGFFTKFDYDLGQSRLLSIDATLTQHASRKFEDRLRNTEESILAVYYFTKRLSAGAGFKNRSGTEESWEGRTYSANMQYYITRFISVNAGFDRFLNANDGRENSKSYSSAVSARF